jgi:hypothetical protein
MTWVAVAIGGAAVIGAGASMAGAKKQGDAAKNSANLQMQQFERINAQQQPFIQSGYGATSRLNTLLGINGNPYGRSQGGGTMQPPAMGGPGPGATYLPTPQGGITQRFGYSPQMQKGPNSMGVPANAPNFNLSRVLAMRAAHGDTEAQRMLETMQS